MRHLSKDQMIERLRAENAKLKEALQLHVDYEKARTDRGGGDGPKGKAWARFIKARDAALAPHDTEAR